MWSFRTETGKMIVSQPLLTSGGTIVFGSWDRHVYAVTREGHLRWSQATHGPISSSPLLLRDVVYVGSGDGALYALNVTDGTIVWVYISGSPLYASPVASNDGAIVYVPSLNGTLLAVDARTGRLQWAISLGRDLRVESSPVVDARGHVL